MDMDLVLHGLQAVLGLLFAALGAAKLAGAATFRIGFARFGFPRWFLTVTGAVEVLGGVGLLVGLLRPEVGTAATALLGATMVGATVAHLRAGDEPSRVAPPIVLLALVGLVGAAPFVA